MIFIRKTLTKTILSFTLFLVILSLTGCAKPGNKEEGAKTTSSGEEKVTIVTSFYPMYILTLNIAKDVPGVEVINMSPPYSGCLHDYQLTPKDLKVLEKARFFVINGAGMESFMDKVVPQQPGLKIIEAGRGIPLIKGDGDEGDNPHVWVSISGALQQVKNIGEQLAAQDPSHADKYRQNTAAYVQKLESLQDQMHRALDGLKNRDIVTFHEAFPYFAKEFNLRIVAVVEREPGTEPSAGELAETIKLVKQAKVKALFAEPQYPAKAAQTIARETGAKVYVLDPAVTGPMQADAYEKIMENNLKVLEEALK